MTASSPTLPAGKVPYPQSEEEVKTGKRSGTGKPKMLDDVRLLNLLRGYFKEGKEARCGGQNPRDANWRANWDSYWGRYDTTGKAEWQAAEEMPEVANFIDRYAATLSMALTSQPEWFEIIDPTDGDGELNRIVREFVKIHLNHCTTNNSGQRVGFEATFRSAVKAGALSLLAVSVTYDPDSGYVNVDPVNAFELYYDPTGRGLYRIRRTEIDYWQLEKMKAKEDSSGEPYYDSAAIERLQSFVDGEAKKDLQAITGGSETGSGVTRKKPVTLDEYLCAIIDEDGHLIAENQLVVIANEREIIRGPEDNPNWHGKDWIVMTPPIDVPFSVLGRTYAEVFRALAATFVETTNLILDGMFAGAIAAHMVWKEALADQSEVANGINPGILVTAAADWPPGKKFIEKIEMGGVDAKTIAVWQAMKSELREGASANELSLGQVPPKGDITAREIDGAERGSNVLSMDTASGTDTRLLQPILELVLMTGLQHFDPEKNPGLARELGEPMSAMIAKNRENFAKRKYKYVAKGLTSAMDRGRRLQQKLGLLQVIGQSEVLAAEFSREHSLTKFMNSLLADFDIDTSTLKKDEKEKRADMEAQLAEKAAAGAAGAPGGPTGAGARGAAPITRIPK